MFHNTTIAPNLPFEDFSSPNHTALLRDHVQVGSAYIHIKDMKARSHIPPGIIQIPPFFFNKIAIPVLLSWKQCVCTTSAMLTRWQIRYITHQQFVCGWSPNNSWGFYESSIKCPCDIFHQSPANKGLKKKIESVQGMYRICLSNYTSGNASNPQWDLKIWEPSTCWSC